MAQTSLAKLMNNIVCHKSSNIIGLFAARLLSVLDEFVSGFKKKIKQK